MSHASRALLGLETKYRRKSDTHQNSSARPTTNGAPYPFYITQILFLANKTKQMPKNARSSHAATVKRNTRLVNLRTAASARIANEDAAARTARLVDLREREATRIANEDAATRSARLADLREREATRIASEDAATRTARLADLREREATRIAHEDAATRTARLADQREREATRIANEGAANRTARLADQRERNHNRRTAPQGEFVLAMPRRSAEDAHLLPHETDEHTKKYLMPSDTYLDSSERNPHAMMVS